MNEAVTIVMIEDDEGHARLIEKNIVRAGVSNPIKHFVNGADALSYLSSEGRPKSLLILLDLNLPDMTGIDILQRLKDDALLRPSPVIVLTTTDDKREIERCYQLGCSVYITKPVEYEHFAHAIRQLGLFFSVIQVPEKI
ncbi:MAG: response regulator [Rhodomicrobium sp.]|nr:response regulator [Rhodomicrobium sp.]